MTLKEELIQLIGIDKVDKIKSTLLKFTTPTPTPAPVAVTVKLEDITLQDGTILTLDKLEVGATASITTAEGVTPAPDGEYVDAEGTTYVVVSGLVTEIKPKEVEGTPSTDMPVDAEAKLAELKSMIANLEKANNDKIEKLITENKSLNAKLGEQSEAVKLALSCIDKIVTAPVAMSLESQKRKPVVAKPYDEMTNFEKAKYNRGLI